MSDAKIGRVLAASLHQAISDIVPTRLDFYESWLDSAKIRERGVGRAPLTAVVSFLRRETGHYDEIVARAGGYAADWSVASLPAAYRSLIRASPRFLKPRVVSWVIVRTFRHLYSATAVRIRHRRGTADVELRESLFCDVRERWPRPLCGFYAALIRRSFESFGVEAVVQIVACRSGGAECCRLFVEVGARHAHGAKPADPAIV